MIRLAPRLPESKKHVDITSRDGAIRIKLIVVIRDKSDDNGIGSAPNPSFFVSVNIASDVGQ